MLLRTGNARKHGLPSSRWREGQHGQQRPLNSHWEMQKPQIHALKCSPPHPEHRCPEERHCTGPISIQHPDLGGEVLASLSYLSYLYLLRPAYHSSPVKSW